MKSMTPYEVLQAASGFKVGDTVKVVRNWKEGEMGFKIGMGQVKVGTTDTIVSIDFDAIRTSDGWAIPFFAVEKVKLPKPPRAKKPTTEEREAAYRTLQKQCGIKVGDYVKVLRIAKDFEMGWPTVWDVDGMNETVGNIYKVHTVDQYGIMLTVGPETSCRAYFPFFVLEKVEKPFEIINVEGDTGAVIATIHEDHVKLHVIDLTHSEARKLGREVAKVAKR
jgi:hypothetical protein